MPTKHRVYLAFQGGGARGISHVGGLAAVNDLNLEIAGVAGTSAGAIIAALVAAGYSSKDILDVDARAHILQRVANGAYEKPTSLFTPNGWGAIAGLIRSKEMLLSGIGWFGRPRPKWIALAPPTIGLIILIAGVCFEPRTTFLALLVLFGYFGHLLRKIYYGLAPLTEVRTVINAAISTARGIEKDDITFADLKSHGGLPLKLVATNVSDQCLELFSYETTPDVAVADAVAASIRLPFIFKSWSLNFKRKYERKQVERWFLDGGLMSNLPVWSFDEERALNPNAVTIAFGLNPAPKPKWIDGGLASNLPVDSSEEFRTSDLDLRTADSGFDLSVSDATQTRKHWLLAAIDAVVAGPPQIHLRGIDRLVHIPLDCTLDLLDFDATFDEFSGDVTLAAEKSKLILERELTVIPGLVSEALEAMRSSVYRELSRIYDGGAPSHGTYLRIALAIQKPNDKLSMTVAYQAGHRATTRRLRIGLDHPTVGAAWQERNKGEAFLDVFLRDGDEAAKLYPDSAWMAVVPVTVVDPHPEELQTSELAVVAIIDSPFQFGFLANDDSQLNAYADDVRRLALEFFKVSDFGRLARRSVSWL